MKWHPAPRWLLLIALAAGVGRASAGAPAPAARGVQGTLSFEKVAGPAAGGAVLGLGAREAFDAEWATCPSVLVDGQGYRMWYASWYDSRMGRGGIGLASSDDGVHWRRAHAGRPLLEPGPPGALDDGQVMGPEVLFDGRTYRMWYTGMAREWSEHGVGYYRVFLATSPDGVTWRRANGGRPVLDLGPPGSHDSVQVATPSILREHGGYTMWYAAWSPEHGHRIGVARSRDGVGWQRANHGQPITGLSPAQAYGPAVCRVGDRYLMLYMALGATRGLYGAASEDGVHWSMLNQGEPLLRPGPAGAFDDTILGHADLLVAGQQLRAWYTGYRREQDGVTPWKLRIGLAEAPVPASVLNQELEDE